MNPFRTLTDAYTKLTALVSDKVDRLERENRARLDRKQTYEAAIQRRHEQMRSEQDPRGSVPNPDRGSSAL